MAAGLVADALDGQLAAQAQRCLVEADHARRPVKAGPAVEGCAKATKDVPPPPVKPKLSAGERRARQEDRLAALRLRMAIGRELDERGIAEPAAIGAALGLSAAEAAKLLTRHQWREGDVTLLTAAAARLGVPAQGAPGAAAADDGDTGE